MEHSHIRPAVPSEAARLTDIAHAAKRHWGYADELLTLWRDDLTVTAANLAERPFYCAAQDGAIVGFHALSTDGGELEHLWVDPPAMGRGHGAALLGHAVECARRISGGGLLRIASDPHAEGFYLRMGAVRAGEVPSSPAGRVLPLLVVRLDAGVRSVG